MGEWLGITVPPKIGVLPRVCVRHALCTAWPTSLDNFNISIQCEIEDVAGAPQWVKVFLFQQLAIRVIPEVVKFQEKIPGSALDRYLNGKGDDCVDAEGLEFIHGLYASITSFLHKQGSNAESSLAAREA